jgi:8-oxo-dGTP pyrophosphatase MutT (NUDIX family)
MARAAKKDAPTHAGVVAFRFQRDVPHVLLVSSSGSASRLVLPKGRIEDDEDPASTALREMFEEAGVHGEIVEPVGKPCELNGSRVQFFLVRADHREVSSPEGRDKHWLTVEMALAKLQPETRGALEAAAKRIVQPAADLLQPRQEELRAFLATEYEHIAAALRDNERNAEARVNVFLALAGVVGSGAVAFLAARPEAASPSVHHVGLALALAIPIAIGALTLFRVAARNAAADRYEAGLARIRRFFYRSAADESLAYAPLDPFAAGSRLPRAGSLGSGPIETVAVVESLLVGVFVAVAAGLGSWALNAAAGLAASVAAWLALVAWARRAHRRALGT